MDEANTFMYETAVLFLQGLMPLTTNNNIVLFSCKNAHVDFFLARALSISLNAFDILDNLTRGLKSSWHKHLKKNSKCREAYRFLRKRS